MSPSTPDQALRKFSCSLTFFPPFKSGVIKPRPVAEPSYWFYCRGPWDILMMYCSINGNWWDRYWWPMVHFTAIHWVPVTSPLPHHLWKRCAVARQLWSILLLLPFLCIKDARVVMITATPVRQALRAECFQTDIISFTSHSWSIRIRNEIAKEETMLIQALVSKSSLSKIL